MLHVFRNRNFYLVFAVDAVLVMLSLLLAYAVRFEFQIPPHEIAGMVRILPYVLLIKVGTFFLFHLYQGMWRYTSLVDMLNVLKATVASSLFVILAVLLIYRFQGYPRSVFLIDWGLTLIFVGGFRVNIRLHFARNIGMGVLPGFTRRHGARRVLVIGAGDTGEKVVREMLDHPGRNLFPVGILDDDEQKIGKAIHGISVVGKIGHCEKFSELFDEILIAIPSASAADMRKIVMACEKTGKPFRTVPSLSELIDGSVSLKAVREVTLQDLLGRDEVHLDTGGIAKYIQGKRVLVTGAGGSIGSELVRQISRFYPDALALVDVSEFNLFRIEMECQQRFAFLKTSAFLVDIREQASLNRAFEAFAPQVVFHAAAYKHVPMQELHPWEAVRNNVLGTRNLTQNALAYGVERFVLVSTDKAVRPTNVMGATKRIAEKLVLSSNTPATTCQFMVVRFGNVLGSSGSVIPLFQEQINRGGPVTVTHPEVTRYFMSIPEAAQLILQAGAMGQGGEAFLLDMGKPVRIADLARDLIRLHGYKPDRDIEIQFIGLRPGEKLYEELITEGEGIVPTDHQKIMVLRGNGHDQSLLFTQIKTLLDVARTYDSYHIKLTLQAIVPEYTPNLPEGKKVLKV